MRIVVLTLILMMLTTIPAGAGTLTCFSDGAVVEIEATARRGVAEVPLLPGMIENSLRITPLTGARIDRVEILPRRKGDTGRREIAGLLERRRRLEERQDALARREEIFAAALKSQSSRAPRKTKTTPDPLLSMGQGTDFALTRLEGAIAQRQKITGEMRRLDERIAGLRSKGSGDGILARVKVSKANGRFRLLYVLGTHSWIPRYDLRVDGDGPARLTLFAQMPPPPAGYRLRAVPGALGTPLTASLPASTGSLVRLMELALPSREVRFEEGPRCSFSTVLTNSGTTNLPAGEASLYRNGEYRGRLAFGGISSGRSRRISSAE